MDCHVTHHRLSPSIHSLSCLRHDLCLTDRSTQRPPSRDQSRHGVRSVCAVLLIWSCMHVAPACSPARCYVLFSFQSFSNFLTFSRFLLFCFQFSLLSILSTTLHLSGFTPISSLESFINFLTLFSQFLDFLNKLWCNIIRTNAKTTQNLLLLHLCIYEPILFI